MMVTWWIVAFCAVCNMAWPLNCSKHSVTFFDSIDRASRLWADTWEPGKGLQQTVSKHKYYRICVCVCLVNQCRWGWSLKRERENG